MTRLLEVLRTVPDRLTALIAPVSVAFIVSALAGLIAIAVMGGVAHWAEPQRQRAALAAQLVQAQGDLAQLRAGSKAALSDLARLRTENERARTVVSALLEAGRDRSRDVGQILRDVASACRGRDPGCPQQELMGRLAGR